MITWSNGVDTGTPRLNFPDTLRLYEVNAYTFGDGLWSVTVAKMPYFPIVHDQFRTQEEAYEFVVVVVNLLELKYPNAKCNNFSFLTNGVTNDTY
jgi:hypothetical protein